MASLLEYGLPDLIKTTSIERVVAPVITHLCHLVLICESGEASEQFAKLERAAESVAMASKNMAAVASRLAAESDDDIMKAEMDPVVTSMKLSGQHILLAAQKLSIQCHLASHRDELITSTQNVLLGLLKILLVEDDAAVRKIVMSAHWLLDCLFQLKKAPDIPSFLLAFQGFSEALLLLNNLAERRAEDLRDPGQQEHLTSSLETLKKCVSMLHTAMCTTIKHPQSEHAQTAKKYIADLVEFTITDVISTLKSSSRRSVFDSTRRFADKIQALYSLLSISKCSSIRESNFDSLLGEVVIHCMLVANTSRKDMQVMVVNTCRCVLQLWLKVSQLTKLPESPSDSSQQRQKDLENTCSFLEQQLHNLNDRLTTAILFQVLDVFAMATAPFDKLVHTTTNSPENVQPLLTAFLSHVDRMVQVASFISALSTDLKCIENVESSRACLTRLKGVAAVLFQDLDRGGSHSAALEKLQDLHQQWAEETNQLEDAFTDILNVKELISLALQEIVCDFSGCERAFKAQSHSQFSEHADNLLGHMNQVVRSVKRHVNQSDNPIFRNGLLVLVKQVEASVVEVSICVEVLVTDLGLNMGSFEEFSQKALKTVKHFHILREGLDGLQHPHLLSPLREEARHTAFPRPAPISEESEDFGLDHIGCYEFSALSTENRGIPSPFYVENLEKHGEKSQLASSSSSGESKKPEFISEVKTTSLIQNIDLLPSMYNVIKATKDKDVTALNVACTRVFELSNSYVQAAKEANTIINDTEVQKLEALRSEVVALTPILVQTAQEAAIGATKSTESIYKYTALFSDGISNMRQILLPTAGTWYHAAVTMLQDKLQKSNNANLLGAVMRLCSDIVQQVTSSDIAGRSEHHENITMLHSKLKKAQTNAKHLIELASSMPVETDKLEGPCILWALSIQVLLDSLDKILGVVAYSNTGLAIRHQVIPQKRLGVVSENSLRIQEAARLTSLICKSNNTIIKMRGLQEEVKSLTEAYLQMADDLSTVPLSDIHQLAQSELLQRQLLLKMKELSSLVSSVNKEYADAVENAVHLAIFTTTDPEEAEQERAKFERNVESLSANVKDACQNIQDCLNYIKDPRVRTNLRSINEHLSFQISDIMCRARQLAETRDIGNMYSLEVQIQYWSAKAHFLVEEIDKVEGVHQETKQQVRLCLQGRRICEIQDAHLKFLPSQKNVTQSPDTAMVCQQANHSLSMKFSELDNQSHPVPKQELRMVGSGLAIIRAEPSLTYTSLFLKREMDKWDAQNNRIVQVTKDMAEKIYYMAQYLRRKGPIQSKEMFVASAKDVVSSCQTVTQFIRVIADHSLNEHSREDLCLILEKILTTTNQLTIISSVNALTPGSKSSDEILVKNAQNLLQIILQGVRAAETACIKGLRQPEPNSDGAEAAALCFQWKKNLQIHRAQQISNPETDDLGLRKTSLHPVAPSLAPSIKMQEIFK